ncbi:MAG: electron transfer flavoprotein subunit alpha/FixB family protein [Proteobacteria bacterium]|nr:electron transfer flavoprotein subunit alpha/FixB family protein [Pseudomonadota bacterium]
MTQPQGILIVAEHRQGVLRPVSLELVTAAQGLRGALGGRVTMAVVGREAQQYAAALSVPGVDDIIVVESADTEFDADTAEHALAALAAELRPALVLLAHSVDSMAYAAASAVRHGWGFATDVFALQADAEGLVATRGGYGQKVNVEVDFPGRATVLLAVRGGSFKPPVGTVQPTLRSLALDGPAPRTRNLAFIEPPSTGDIDMTAKEFILSVGRGVGEQDNIDRFRELADSLGAALGCSRPVADSGWLPKSRQIGQSGKTAVQCKLYIAMGISGAIQHLAGMKHVDTVIAVNTDPNASIFTVARYGVVGDMFEIADELQKQFA